MQQLLLVTPVSLSLGPSSGKAALQLVPCSPCSPLFVSRQRNGRCPHRPTPQKGGGGPSRSPEKTASKHATVFSEGESQVVSRMSDCIMNFSLTHLFYAEVKESLVKIHGVGQSMPPAPASPTRVMPFSTKPRPARLLSSLSIVTLTACVNLSIQVAGQFNCNPPG